MFEKVKAVMLAAAMMMAPLAAPAATIVAPGGSYDLLADAYTYDGKFRVGTRGQTYTFSFTNTSTSAVALTVTGVNVRQATAAFTNGVKLTAGPFSFAFDKGKTGGAESSFRVGAEKTVNVVLSFGRVVDAGIRNGKGVAQVGFDIEATVVPVPATGLLLLSAVGGLAMARRRKSVASPDGSDPLRRSAEGLPGRSSPFSRPRSPWISGNERVAPLQSLRTPEPLDWWLELCPASLSGQVLGSAASPAAPKSERY